MNKGLVAVAICAMLLIASGAAASEKLGSQNDSQTQISNQKSYGYSNGKGPGYKGYGYFKNR